MLLLLEYFAIFGPKKGGKSYLLERHSFMQTTACVSDAVKKMVSLSMVSVYTEEGVAKCTMHKSSLIHACPGFFRPQKLPITPSLMHIHGVKKSAHLSDK